MARQKTLDSLRFQGFLFSVPDAGCMQALVNPLRRRPLKNVVDFIQAKHEEEVNLILLRLHHLSLHSATLIILLQSIRVFYAIKALEKGNFRNLLFGVGNVSFVIWFTHS